MCVALLWQMWESAKRLLEVPHGFAMGRLRHSLLPCLPAIHQGLIPHFALQRMIGQTFDLLGHPISGKRLKGCNDTGMQHPPLLQQEAAIGHLVRQGVLEGVFRLGKQAGLVQELRRLEVCQATVQCRFRQVRNGPQQGKGHVHANHRSGLEQVLLLRRQAVDARCQHCLHRGRDLNRRQRLRQAVCPGFAHQHSGLHQGAHAFLQKEGVARGAGNQQGLERCQARVVPQQGVQELVGTRRRQRVEPQLRVVRLAAPAVLVLGPVIDQ